MMIRTHVRLSALRAHGSAELTGREERKRAELRLAVHSLGGGSINRESRNPSTQSSNTAHITCISRHVNIPTLVMARRSALQVVGHFSAERRASAPIWDGLLLGSAQPRQLDLACDIEAVWPSIG